MIQNTTSATPRLDWLRSHLILALQELQGWVDSLGGIAAFIDPQGLNDWDIWSFWVEWDTDSLELRLVPALDSNLKLIPGRKRPLNTSSQRGDSSTTTMAWHSMSLRMS